MAGIPGGGSGITVEDEGSVDGTGIDTLDFAGAGVSVAVTGSEATITIPGGGSGTVVGRVPLVGPLGFSSFSTYGTSPALAALAAGVAGAIDVPIHVTAPMYLEGYSLFNGDTAAARALNVDCILTLDQPPAVR